jgi:hypothetical protein
MKSNAYYARALLIIVALAAVAIALFGRPRQGGGDFWEASSFNPEERGHKAFYTTLEELHWPVMRWQSSYRQLSGTNQVMIMARNSLGHRYSLQETEIEALLNWVAAGNRWIFLGDFADSADAQPLFQKLGFPSSAPRTAEERIFEQGSQFLTGRREPMVVQPTVLLRTMDDVTLERCLPLPTPPEKGAVLLKSGGKPYAIEVPWGRGSVTFIATAALLDNKFLPLAGNLDFALKQMDRARQMPEKIWFEEAHHGYRTDYALIDFLKQSGIQIAAIQTLIGLLFFLIGQRIRFGPLRPLQPAKARSTLEFVNSLASLYHRANLRNDIVRALFRETHQAVLRKFNLPPRASHDVIAKRLGEAFPHLPRWKKLAQRFDSTEYVQGLPPSGWLKVSRELILIKNAML